MTMRRILLHHVTHARGRLRHSCSNVQCEIHDCSWTENWVHVHPILALVPCASAMIEPPVNGRVSRSVADVLDEVAAQIPQDEQISNPRTGVVLEDFRPLQQSLEWRLSQHFWQTRGLRPFQEGAVPYGANSSGWAPTAAAELLFENAKERNAASHSVHVLELGAGTGLFARQLLDTLQRICVEQDSDLYDRLTYVVTDRSPASVRQWQELGIFDAHAGRVEFARCDALLPMTLLDLDGAEREMPPPRAVFLNYTLDSLPTAVVRRGPKDPEQLHIRTLWGAEMSGKAAPTADDLEQLLLHYPDFEFETDFRAEGARDLPLIDEVLACGAGPTARLLNYGAMQCLETCLSALAPAGFVLVNDYGPVKLEDVEAMSFVHRFAASTAAGIHFPFLEQHVASLGGRVVKVEGDRDRTIHSRLLSMQELPETRSTYLRVFGSPAYLEADRVSARANEYATAGRCNAALECCREGLRHYPSDWVLLGQAAELCNQRFAHHQQALELASRGLEINPWTSAHLWNTHGNCLFALERHAEALQSYRRAEAIHPDDPQTQFNLAFSRGHSGHFAEALEAIARGLAHDTADHFRASLLEKQSQILAALSGRRAAQEARARGRYGSYSRED